MKLLKSLLLIGLIFGLMTGCATNWGGPHGLVDVELLQVPEVKAAPEPQVTVIKEKVLFAFDSYKLDAEADATVEKVAGLMKKFPDTKIILEGYTDKYGPEDYNMKLSINRAEAVQAALIDEGISKDSIVSVKGFGKTKLIPNLSNRENRRVLILSIGDK
jgi:outer membrane protein OmpA-like peptidoglycan-associated protein